MKITTVHIVQKKRTIVHTFKWSTLYRLDVTILVQIEHTFCDQGNSQHYVVNHLWIKRPSIPKSSSRQRQTMLFTST